MSVKQNYIQLTEWLKTRNVKTKIIITTYPKTS